MDVSIQFKRGNFENLPESALSGMPLWCEDTNELYIGTGSGIAKVGSTETTSSSDNTTDTSDLDETYEKIEKTILFPEADENYCFNLTDNSINRITFSSSESDEAEEDEYEDEVTPDLGETLIETSTSSSSSRTESSEDITYTIVLPEITDTDKYHQILVQIDYQNSVTLDLGTTYFFNQEEPDFSNLGTYNLVYEHDGSNWCVGCIYKGEA
ncbi:MAG: hypothetical protein LUE64_05090 [Candidatus Gastranaerophilales bacterium]|nr:hypothetical protein [Candidatus Gastranaerophilales bacterium]